MKRVSLPGNRRMYHAIPIGPIAVKLPTTTVLNKCTHQTTLLAEVRRVWSHALFITAGEISHCPNQVEELANLRRV